MATMSMNKVIHAAVRRDLDRFLAALAGFPDGDAARAADLGRAWVNFDTFLTDHHEGEHEIAWPHLERAGIHAGDRPVLGAADPFDHVAVERRPALLEQALLGEGVLGVEDQDL